MVALKKYSLTKIISHREKQIVDSLKWRFSDFDHFGVHFLSEKVSRSFGKDYTRFGKEVFFQENSSETLKERNVSFCASPAVSLWAGSKSVDGYIMGGPSCEQCMLKSSFESLVQFRCQMGWIFFRPASPWHPVKTLKQIFLIPDRKWVLQKNCSSCRFQGAFCYGISNEL